jgi:diguanylate cyclase
LPAVDPSDAVHEAPRPSFSLHEAEEIVRRLAPALQAHALWIERIHTILICRIPPDAEEIEADGHLRTALGQWLADEHNEFLSRHPDYAAAVDQHRQVHILARGLCAAVGQGRPILADEYKTFADGISRLDHSLEALVKELWDLLRYTDPLTGIATRYAMLPRLREEHQRVQRTGLISSICMVDLDHFKQINDTYGHQAGDLVLHAVSGYLVDNLRRYDQVCRYGGEEFVLMLPNTPPQQAVPIVDRLRSGIASLVVRLDDGTEVKVTASIGVAALSVDQPIGASIEDADRAMYAAKRAGRNRVHLMHRRDAARPTGRPSPPEPTARP